MNIAVTLEFEDQIAWELVTQAAILKLPILFAAFADFAVFGPDQFVVAMAASTSEPFRLGVLTTLFLPSPGEFLCLLPIQRCLIN